MIFVLISGFEYQKALIILFPFSVTSQKMREEEKEKSLSKDMPFCSFKTPFIFVF